MVALVSTASAWRCGVAGEELGEEAAVSVAEDEGVAAVEECGEVVECGSSRGLRPRVRYSSQR